MKEILILIMIYGFFGLLRPSIIIFWKQDYTRREGVLYPILLIFISFLVFNSLTAEKKIIKHVRSENAAYLIKRARELMDKKEYDLAELYLEDISEDDSLYGKVAFYHAKIDSLRKLYPSKTKLKESSPKKKESKSTNRESSKYIKGLMPVDVYLNMDKRGFNTEFFPEGKEKLGHMWISKLTDAGIEYEVGIWTMDANKVQTIDATAMCFPPKKIIASLQFIQYVSSLPYDNSQPQKAVKWVSDNFNKDKATTTIGGVKFTLYVPSNYVRMLMIETAK